MAFPLVPPLPAITEPGQLIGGNASGIPSIIEPGAAGQVLTVGASGSLEWSTAAIHDPVTVSDTASIDLSLTGQALSAAAIFGGTGAAGTVARSDHNHDGTYSATAHNHDAAYTPNVMTTKGDILYHNGTGVARLPIGALNQMLQRDGSANLFWGLVGTASISDFVQSMYNQNKVMFIEGSGIDFTYEDTARNITITAVPYPDTEVLVRHEFATLEPWLVAGNAAGSGLIDSVENHPGIYRLIGTGTNGTVARLFLGSSSVRTGIGAITPFTGTWIVRPMDSIQPGACRVGYFGGSAGDDPIANGIWFEADSDQGTSATNWVLCSANGSATTRLASSVAFTSGTWYNLRIERTSSNITYYINNVLAGTITTNISLASLAPIIQWVTSGGAGRSIDADLHLSKQTVVR